MKTRVVRSDSVETGSTKQCREKELSCPVCDSRCPKPLTHEVAMPLPRLKRLKVYRCGRCGCFFFWPLKVRDYQGKEIKVATDFYVQIGAGIEAMFNLLVRLPTDGTPRLLEIGSGYGFLLDVWRFLSGKEGIGIEPHPYGESGEAELGVVSRRELLQPRSPDDGEAESFDFVIASEVIEHVADPKEFIRLLCSHLSPGGVLVLTTPSTYPLEVDDAPDCRIFSTLSPGHHTILLPETVLTKILDEAGLHHRMVLSDHVQLVVYASREPLRLIDLPFSERGFRYREYLESIWERADPNSRLALGAGFRLVESLVNGGEFEKAQAWLERLEKSLCDCYPFYRESLESAVQEIVRPASSRSLLKQVPFFAPSLEYLRGMVSLLWRQDRAKAALHFDSATSIGEKLMVSYPAAAAIVSPLLWRTRFESASARARLSGEKRKEGLKDLRRLRRADSSAPEEWQVRASVDRLKALMDLRRHSAAGEEMASLEGRWSSGSDPILHSREDPAAAAERLKIAPCEDPRVGHFAWYLLLRSRLTILCEAASKKSATERECAEGEIWRLLEITEDYLLWLTSHPVHGELGNLLLPESRITLADFYEKTGDLESARGILEELSSGGERGGVSGITEQARNRLEALNREESRTDVTGYHPVALCEEGVHIQIESTWSDDLFAGISGFCYGPEGVPEGLDIRLNDCRPEITEWMDRPDVVRDLELSPNMLRCGFRMFYRKRRSYHITCQTTQFGRRELRIPAIGQPPLPPPVSEGPKLEDFAEMVNREARSVLEIGSRVVSPGSTSKRFMFSPDVRYIGFDFHPDGNTDVTGDAHHLCRYFPEGQQFDAVFSLSVLEHIAMPWKVAVEISRVLKIGGLSFHQVPFAWPVHELPWDFWRFTHQGLKSLFSPALGFEWLSWGMDGACSVHPTDPRRVDVHFPVHATALSASILVRKVAEIDSGLFHWDTDWKKVLPGEGIYPKTGCDEGESVSPL